MKHRPCFRLSCRVNTTKTRQDECNPSKSFARADKRKTTQIQHLLSDILTALSDYSLTLEYGFYAEESRDFVFAGHTNAWPLFLLEAGLFGFCSGDRWRLSCPLCGSCTCVIQSLYVPAPDAVFIGSRRLPGSRRPLPRLQTPPGLQTPYT